VHERPYQSQAVRRGEEIIHVRVGVSNLHSRSRLARRSVQEKWNRHLKDLGNVLQPAGANTVGSLLIFLNLLKRQSEPIRKRLPTCPSMGLRPLLGTFAPCKKKPRAAGQSGRGGKHVHSDRVRLSHSAGVVEWGAFVRAAWGTDRCCRSAWE
jgi:hypothetical protein